MRFSGINLAVRAFANTHFRKHGGLGLRVALAHVALVTQNKSAIIGLSNDVGFAQVELVQFRLGAGLGLEWIAVGLLDSALTLKAATLNIPMFFAYLGVVGIAGCPT